MRILGLDISKTSGGFTEYVDGEYFAQIHSINVDKKEDGRFIKCFESLRDFIDRNYSDRFFDVVIVEDIFFESNVDTFRVLSVLNLCVDWCVAEGVVSCGEYVKVSNKTWKSWLFTNDSYKGMADKERIRLNVINRGITYDGLAGFQDMYDSTGMIMGYLQRNEVQQKPDIVKQKNNLKLRDLNCLYFLFQEELWSELELLGVEKKDIKFFKTTRLSEKTLLELVSGDENLIYVSESKVNIGNMGEVFGVSPLVGGGYLAVWCKGVI